MLSMKQKVEAMGFNAEEFWGDMMSLEDTYREKCFMNGEATREHLTKPMKEFKEKYGFSARLNYLGIDIARMDTLINVEYETAKSRGALKC